MRKLQPVSNRCLIRCSLVSAT